jgi:CheY-like chemotaxis protein
MSRILVVDDNTSMREAVCEMLQQAGYETISVENGRLAAQIHRSDPVDLIITDLFMPDTVPPRVPRCQDHRGLRWR